jgi:protease-4
MTDTVHHTDPLTQELAKVTIQEKRWAKGKHVVTLLAMALVVFFEVSLLGPYLGAAVAKSTSDALGVVHLEGDIKPGAIGSADKVVPALKAAFDDPHVKRVALYIDSPGGSPVEAERIRRYMEAKRKETGKPTVAIIGNMGASAAYLSALGADEIVSAKFSLVGSIGAIIQGWDLSKVLEKAYVTPRVYASGPMKAMLNPFLPPNEAAQAKAQDLANRAGQMFAREVSDRRGAKLKTKEFATGEVWDGEAALAIGLVDKLSTLDSYAESHKLELSDFGPVEKKPLGVLGAAAEVGAKTLVEQATRELSAQMPQAGLR